MKTVQLAFALLLGAIAISAQGPIEDNSFLLEEAYNQEKGVIQYIQTFHRERGGNFAYSFTNEMPIKKQQHQFSYTINAGKNGGSTRFGDTYINYRYQMAGLKEEDKVAVAPRFSLILPTGSYRQETGNGALGFQFNLPVSVTHSKKFVTHWNAGTTFVPKARSVTGEKANIKAFNLGQSTVFLAKSNFNVLVETVWGYNEKVIARNLTESEYSLLVNPAIRWAWNMKSGLQIVPGIGVPLGVGPSRGERGIFLYLSLEK
ncbi:MAG: hypothetical protein QM785_16870 [Pyrinomonadaceae bacterium]